MARISPILKETEHLLHEEEGELSQGEEELDRSVVLAGLQVPSPVFFCSIEPPSMAYQKDLDLALECLQREDPSLKVEF